MSVHLRHSWTQQEFFAWAEQRDTRYEFDGQEPVAMGGGTVNHAIIMRNLHRALDARPRGTPGQMLGPDAGLETIGKAVRYPDALITCAKLVGSARTVPGVVAVFEILSPSTGRQDRIIKLREYAAVPSIRRYVMLESDGVGLMVLEREDGDRTWSMTTLMSGEEQLHLPEVGIQIPVAEFYEGVEFSEAGPPGA